MTKSDSSQSSLRRTNDSGLHRAALIGGAAPVKSTMMMRMKMRMKMRRGVSADRYWTVASAQIMRNFWHCGLFFLSFFFFFFFFSFSQLSPLGSDPPLARFSREALRSRMGVLRNLFMLHQRGEALLKSGNPTDWECSSPVMLSPIALNHIIGQLLANQGARSGCLQRVGDVAAQIVAEINAVSGWKGVCGLHLLSASSWRAMPTCSIRGLITAS